MECSKFLLIVIFTCIGFDIGYGHKFKTHRHGQYLAGKSVYLHIKDNT